MSVEFSTSTSSTLPFTPMSGEPPKIDEKKEPPPLCLEPKGAAESKPAPTQTKSVLTFVVSKKTDDAGRKEAQQTGKEVLGWSCGVATGALATAGATAGGQPWMAAVAGPTGFVVGKAACERPGELIGGAVHDLKNGGPVAIRLEPKLVTVEVPAPKADAKPTTTDAKGADARGADATKTPSKEQPASAATSSATTSAPPSKPAPAATSADRFRDDANASYLRAGK